MHTFTTRELVAYLLIGIPLWLFLTMLLVCYIRHRSPPCQQNAAATPVPWREFITERTTGQLDFKMLAMFLCANIQALTWIRMSMGYNVNPALASPQLWVTFYCVIAGHDLLGKLIEAWSGMRPNMNNPMGRRGFRGADNDRGD